MKKIVILLTTVLLCFSFVSCKKETTQNDVITYYNAAEKLINEGDFSSAKKIIDEAVSIYGNSALLNSLLIRINPSESQSESVETTSETTVFTTEVITETPTTVAQTTTTTMSPTPSQKAETTPSTTTTTKPAFTEFTVPTTKPFSTRVPTTQYTTRYITTTKPSTTQTTTQKSSQEKALDLAKSFAQQTNDSRSQMINRIKGKGYSETDAVYAVDSCDINWNNQAIKAAKKYSTNGSGYSYEALKAILLEDKFTESEAQYAVDNAGIDWYNEAVKEARSYLDRKKYPTAYWDGFSQERLISQLEYGKFTHEQAVYGVNNCNADWNEQAVLSAKHFIHYDPDITDEELYDKLINDYLSGGFSNTEAEYAVSHCR